VSFFSAFDETTLRSQLSPLSSGALQRLSLLDQTASTNALLLQMPTLERHAHAVLADHQTAGRGRRGRSWQSPPGSNIYLSLGWNFDRAPADLSCLPLAVGVATVRALEQACVSGLGLKWPNDIVVGGKKLGGILVESKPFGQNGFSLVLGVGINVSMSPESLSVQSIDQPWTTVSKLLSNQPDIGLRDRVAGILLDQLLECVSSYAGSGFQAYDEDWQRLDVLVNQLITVNVAGKELHGHCLGIDGHGLLQVAEYCGSIKQQLHSFNSAEVSVRLG